MDLRVCLSTKFIWETKSWLMPYCLSLSSLSELRICRIDMTARKLMPIHIAQHLKALDRLADMDVVDRETWTLVLNMK